MNVVELKEEIHKYIDAADEEKLAEIYNIIEKEDAAYNYTPEDIEMLYKRRDAFLSGKGKNYTIEESFKSIR
jgi:predicted house-cleaning noncanonical NTP pyrophosphatase (MazG superfamily)